MRIIILLVSFLFISFNAFTQYDYGLQVCGQDARIEGKLELNDGTSNIIIGENTGTQNSGVGNVFIGVGTASTNTSGSFNTFIGPNTGNSNTTGDRNLFIGQLTGAFNSSGNDNLFIGFKAGLMNTTNSNNKYIGNSAGGSASGSNNIVIGNSAAASLNASNILFIENSASITPLIWGDFSTNDVQVNGNLCYTGSFTTCSDKRYKRDIQPISNAVKSIQRINGIKHTWRHDEFPDMVWKKGVEYGVIAQEVQEVFPELVNEDKNGYLFVDYAKVTPILIEAIKEQQAIIENLNNSQDAIVSRLSKLESLLL